MSEAASQHSAGSKHRLQPLTTSALEDHRSKSSGDGSQMVPGRFVGSRIATNKSQVSEATTASSNPSVWDNNIPRKMMDMQWQFSANPLRVADCGGKHWKRLTATYKSMIPQPGGGVKILKQKYPRISDEELLRQVANSGVSKPKPERKLPPLPDPRDVNTPLLRERLKKSEMPAVPKPPKLVLVAGRPIKEQLEEFMAQDDASSCFSQSTVANTTAVAAGNKSRAQKSDVASTALATGSRASKANNKATGSVASHGTARSSKASRLSKVSQLQEEIQREREARQKTEEQLSDVAESLSRVEALLADRK